MKRYCPALGLAALLAGAWPGSCSAAADDAKGLWMTAQRDAVIEFAACAGQAGALCGRIVWDKDAGSPADTCGIEVVQLARYEQDAWRDGWVHDPRDKKTYKGIVRVKDGVLKIRAFIGVEILGQTEQLSRIAALPAAPACKK